MQYHLEFCIFKRNNWPIKHFQVVFSMLLRQRSVSHSCLFVLLMINISSKSEFATFVSKTSRKWLKFQGDYNHTWCLWSQWNLSKQFHNSSWPFDLWRWITLFGCKTSVSTRMAYGWEWVEWGKFQVGQLALPASTTAGGTITHGFEKEKGVPIPSGDSQQP